MQMHRIGARAHKAFRAWTVIAGFQLVAGWHPALAQSPSPTPASAGEPAPSEAVRRQALSPYRFILQHANAPARPKAPAPAAPAEPKRPAAAAPVEQAAIAPRAAPVQQAPVAAPAPEPVAAIVPAPAEPAPVAAARLEIIPIKTDDPRLPAALLRERPSGVVKVSFEVMPDGSTSSVKVVSSTNRSLNRASIEAVSGWKFEPVDQALPVETELAYHFD